MKLKKIFKLSILVLHPSSSFSKKRKKKATRRYPTKSLLLFLKILRKVSEKPTKTDKNLLIANFAAKDAIFWLPYDCVICSIQSMLSGQSASKF